jgi:hypothetical protein
MKVHVVTVPHTSESGSQILPRLARTLEALGWTVGKRRDPKADIQYYFPYLLYDTNETMCAAWFTHREEGMPDKAAMWSHFASQVDLRTVSTRLYAAELGEFGETALVTPPLDRDKFSPAHRNSHSKPVVGVAGYVYPRSGRKGEEMVARLAGDPMSAGMELTAAGHGWPVPTRTWPWGELEEFYRQLDVFLCASTIEGPGYPPLEALACGVKTVVPRSVGVFDELPKARGLVRYERGNYDDMCRALRDALAVEADPEELRATTERFTLDAWLAGHERAFDDLLHPVPAVPGGLPDWRGNCGVYMVAYGDPARACAETAIASWHRYMPGVPVCLAAEEPVGPEDVFVEVPDADLGARSVKTRIYDLAPQEWQYVIYVDADTEVTADVGFLFDLLADGWEMFICYNPEQYVMAGNMVRPDNEAECDATFELVGTSEFLQYNGGVFGFRRCDRTARFFRDWHREWGVWGKRDQAALDRALYADPLRVYTLGVEWNCVTRYYDKSRSAGIVHYPTRARRWQGIIRHRLDNPQAWRDAGLR